MNAIQPKRLWYLIFGLFVLALPIYAWVLHTVEANPTRYHSDPTALHPYLYALAGVVLFCAIGISLWVMPNSSTTRQFRKSLIVALSLALSCYVLGMLLFFLGAPAREAIPFQIATFSVDLLFILPQIVLCPADKLVQEPPTQPKYTKKQIVLNACFVIVWCILVFCILPLVHAESWGMLLWLVATIISVFWERKRRRNKPAATQ